MSLREGTDDDLVKLHHVEAPIESERGSKRMPGELADYMAFARSLPPQFDDHGWLVEDPESGDPLASAYCWSNSAGDPRVMECDVLVRADQRRRGIGSTLFTAICDETTAEGRSLLTWSTFSRIPGGDAFSRSVRGTVARVNRTSELTLSTLDTQLLERWASADRARTLGYSLDVIDGPFPERLREDAATFHHIMQTAPRDDLRVADTFIDGDHVAELDRALLDAGRIRWTLLVRDPAGVCVGGTEVLFEPDDDRTAYQQNTGIDPDHRGLGLAKWAKAIMLQRIIREHPQISRVETGNAYSNGPVLAINEALGFVVTANRTEWLLNLRP